MVFYGSGFHIYVVLIYLPPWRTVVSSIKNGSGIVSPIMFIGYLDQNKKIPQYFYFRCGRVHIDFYLNKTGIKYILQPTLLKLEMDHDDIYEDTWKDKKEWLPYLKDDLLSTAFS